MSPTPNKRTIIPDQLAQDIARMEEEVRRQEESGQFNTASHEVLANLKRAAQTPAVAPENDKEQ